MIRFRTPGGEATSGQLRACALALEELGLEALHLTTRGSLEFHHETPAQAEDLKIRMALAGLGNFGACGPVVRGAAVSTPLHPDAPKASTLAGGILAHFSRRDALYPLPRKFKVGVDAGYAGSRHLIQDAGFVRTGEAANGESLYDLWLAGGLGREPIPAFPFRAGVPESAIIPLLEAVVAVFLEHGEPRKRLKHLVLAKGRDWFRENIEASFPGELPGTPPNPAGPGQPGEKLVPHALLPLFAGQASAVFLRAVAEIADRHCGGVALLTPDQDLALVPVEPSRLNALIAAIENAGLEHTSAENRFAFRVCPGQDHCPKALSTTLDLAGKLKRPLEASGAKSAAISGCQNSCAQPQLAGIGIMCVKRVKTENGGQKRYFAVLKSVGEGFAQTILDQVDEELLEAKLSELSE